jgi:malonyl CoA-acyl carrier protein transacylase
MMQDGIVIGIEVGPGKVLQGLSKRINPALNMYGAETHQDILNLANV